MRYTHGKWIASVKDTYSVDTTLNKIVYAHISKLYNCLKESECAGVPMHYVELQAALDGVEDKWEGDVDKAHLLRMKDLEELLWVFGTEEPDISDYDFDYPNWHTDTESGGMDLTCSNEVERDRYHTDCLAYEKRKQAGYVLFGQIYNYLSW